MVEETSCSPICKSSDILIFNNNFEDLIFCKNCSLLKKKNLDKYRNKVLFLDKFNKNVKEIIDTEYYKKQIDENKSMIKKILKITKSNPTRILDYGCGYGSYMFAAKNLNFEIFGYDINENFTKNLSEYFETFKSELDLLNSNNLEKFDLIFCRKVLTLSSDIYGDFNNLNKLLSTNGYLVIMDHVKNFSKYKSIITQNNNNTLLLTIQTLEFYANYFKLNTKYIQNDFGDIFIIFERNSKNFSSNKISIKTLRNFEKTSFIFLFMRKIKKLLKKIYNVSKS